MEVTMVHPDNPEQKIIATHPQQVTAYRNQGFVEEEAPKEKSAHKEAEQTSEPKEGNPQVADTEQPKEEGSK